MATRKTTTKTTNSEEIEEAKSDVTTEQTSVHVTTSTPAPKQSRKFLPDDRIMTRSVTTGELIYVGVKTKLPYSWADYGDTCAIEFQDLQALAAMRHRFLVDPLFIIEDEELVEQWSSLLSPIYNRIDIESIDEIFAMQPKDFKNAVMNAPKGFQNAIRTRAVKMINTQELYDVRKIKALDEVFGTDLINMLD